jgi:uncharacterized protein (DUF58 family)
VSPTPRAALAVGILAVSALVVPWQLAALGVLGLLTAAAVDALAARRPPAVDRAAPRVLYLGVPARLGLRSTHPPAGRLLLRQPLPPDLSLVPSESEGAVDGELRARRRGRHPLPAPAARVTGPLGLGSWHHRPGADQEIVVYPNLPAAFRLARAARQSRFRETGRHRRGPLGLGTEFESIRDYVPDDDIRQVNWRATARLGRPMSNEFRVEQDRDVVCLVDTGRLMGAPLGEHTRLDVAVDAVAAMAAVAEEMGDRCGVVAFDSEVRRRVAPRHRNARGVVAAVFDLEPVPAESDYDLAFHVVADLRRAFVLVLTDLLEETAARPLLEALPVLRRRHAVAVASATDPDLDRLAGAEPRAPLDVYRAAVALDVLAARARVATLLRREGADVIEAPPERLPAACVRAYLRAKARARL